MEEMMRSDEYNFDVPIEADFVVSLKAKSGDYALFVEAFTRRNGKAYLRHTADIREAARFSRFKAEEIAQQVAEYRCTGQVERVSWDNTEREVVTRAVVGESTSPKPVAQVSHEGLESEKALADQEAAENKPMLDKTGQPVIEGDPADLRAATLVDADVAAARNHIMTALLDRLDLMETRLIAAIERSAVPPQDNPASDRQ